MSRRGVVLRVYCGHCEDEGRTRPGRVGEVHSDGEGSVSWFVHDRRRRRLGNKEEFVAGVPLRHAAISWYEPPETLFAQCERHGVGRVSSALVLNARGTVTLKFTA